MYFLCSPQNSGNTSSDITTKNPQRTLRIALQMVILPCAIFQLIPYFRSIMIDVVNHLCCILKKGPQTDKGDDIQPHMGKHVRICFVIRMDNGLTMVMMCVVV